MESEGEERSDRSDDSEKRSKSTHSTGSAEESEDEYAETVQTQDVVGNFTNLIPIGKGGFCRIYRATHCYDGKDYALKEMLKARILSKRCLP